MHLLLSLPTIVSWRWTPARLTNGGGCIVGGGGHRRSRRRYHRRPLLFLMTATTPLLRSYCCFLTTTITSLTLTTRSAAAWTTATTTGKGGAPWLQVVGTSSVASRYPGGGDVWRCQRNFCRRRGFTSVAAAAKAAGATTLNETRQVGPSQQPKEQGMYVEDDFKLFWK